jgi:hypothetical protein
MELLTEHELFYELCQGLEAGVNSHCYRGLFRVRLRGEGPYLDGGLVVVEACPEDGDAVEYGFEEVDFGSRGGGEIVGSKGWAKVE